MQYYTGKDNLSSKEDTQMAQRHLKRRSTLLTIREMQIEVTMRQNLTPVEMAIVQKTTNTKCQGDCGEERALLQCQQKCAPAQTLESGTEVPRKLHTDLPTM